MADIGVKIAADGDDALTTPEQSLKFTSKRNHLKAAKWAEFSYTFSSNPGVGAIDLGSVAHGLPFTPGYDVMIDFGLFGEFVQNVVAYYPSSGIFDMTFYLVYAKIVGSNLVFRFSRYDFGAGAPFDLTGVTIRFKYRIHGDAGA